MPRYLCSTLIDAGGKARAKYSFIILKVPSALHGYFSHLVHNCSDVPVISVIYNSPDLNPIGELFAEPKAFLKSIGSGGKGMLMSNLNRFLRSFPIKFAVAKALHVAVS